MTAACLRFAAAAGLALGCLVWLLAVQPTATAQRTTSAGATSGPPVPFEDVGACPFEGCSYREWTANAKAALRADRRVTAPVVFTVKAGEKVTGVTGVVVTLKAGRVLFHAPTHIKTLHESIDVLPGQSLYLLTNQGEGFYKVWFNGRLYSDAETWKFINDVCRTEPERCTGKVVEPSKTVWWVQIRNQRGQLGWTHEVEKFDGKDEFGDAR